MVKKISKRVLSMFMVLAVMFSLLPSATLVSAEAYTPPTALRVLWQEGGGTDQTATCHDYNDYITNVTLSDGTNNLIVCSDGAEDNTNDWHTDFGRTLPQIPMAEVVKGEQYTISVTVSGDDLAFQFLAVYIDWNQNNVNATYTPSYAMDDNEEVAVWYSYATGAGQKTLTKTFTVPTGIPSGKIYLRVMLDADGGGSNGGDPQCGVGYGEFEDYVLNVTDGASVPSVSTSDITVFDDVSATLGGNVISDGGATVTERGVVYSSTDIIPEIEEANVTKAANGTGTGEFGQSISGLSASTTYYVRAYAINSVGTAYGSVISFTTSAGSSDDDNDIWDGTIASGFAGGNGTSGYPYLIATGAQLAYMAQQVNANVSGYRNAYYKLTADIDLNSRQWTPIGISNSNDFYGNFNGNGHVVSNLSIGSVSSPFTLQFAGLFGDVGFTGDAVIENVGVENVLIYSQYTSNYGRAGGLAGFVKGTVANCYATGSIICSRDNTYLGGLIGQINPATVTNCYADVDITGLGSTGDAGAGNTTLFTNIGGLIGRNANQSSSTVTNCYANGNVTGNGTNARVGGLVGYMGLAPYNTNAVTNCYATGTAFGGGGTYAGVGGLVGYNVSGVITNSYWNTTANAAGVGYNGGTNSSTGKSSSEMKLAQFVTDLNNNRGTNVEWKSDGESKNDGYPMLNGIGVGKAPVSVNTAPTASNVQISGTAKKGETLTGSYTYSDAEGDDEGTSIFKWYRADDASGTNKTAISGAEGLTYTLQTADVGKYISFEVTPVAQTGTTTGTPVPSLYTGLVEEITQPMVTTTSGTTTYVENGSNVVVDSGITVSDADSATLESATVAITGNFQTGADVLAFTNNNASTMGNITGSYNSGTGVLTLTSAGATATVVQWQSALRAVTYINTSDEPSTDTRTISFMVNDGTDNSNTATKSVSVTSVNDAPTLSVTVTNPAFTEGGSAVNLFTGAYVSTVESGQTITSLNLSVTNVNDGASEILNIDGIDVALTNGNSGVTSSNSMNYNVSVSGSTATVTVLKTEGIATSAMQTLINGIKYRNTSQYPSATGRVVTLTSIKDNGGTANGGADTATLIIASTVTVVPVNEAPTGSVAISGSAGVGQVLTAVTSSISDPNGLGTFGYQWQVSSNGTSGWADISANSTSSTFTVTINEAGKYVRVKVSYTDGGGTLETLESTAIGPNKTSQSAITYENITKTYGDADFTHSATGGSGTGTFSYSSSDTSVASIDSTTGEVTIHIAGAVTITATKSGDSAYETASQSCTLTVNKAVLTATVGDYSKTYGDANPSFTVNVTGFVNTDTAETATGYTAPTASCSATATTDAGEASITISGGSADNYEFNVSDTGTLTINQRILTATATANSKTYDGNANTTGTISLDNNIGSDDVSASGIFSFADANAGNNKTVNVTGITLSGEKQGNYTLNGVTTATTTANISQVLLTAKVGDYSKTYGDSNPDFEVVVTGFVNGETAATAAGYAAPTASSAATASTGAGTASITISGGSADNYTFDIMDTGTLTINKALLTATVSDYSKTYGDNNPAFEVAVTGFVNGETAATATGYTAPTASTTATVLTDVGTASITISGGSADNYTINTDDTATLTINKKALTATATANSKTYDGNTSSIGTISLEGIVGTDDITAGGTFAFESAQAGESKTVNVTGITLLGAKKDNYTVNATATATATINKASIDGITFSDLTATYDGTEKSIVISGTLPDGASVSYSNNAGTNAGTYNATATITGGTNYNGTVLNAMLTIKKVQLTATVGDYSKTYGDNNPAYEIAVTGFVNGETAATAVGYTEPAASTTATTTTGAGIATITISGGSADNYTFDVTDTGTLTINKAVLTVTVEDNSKIYGEENPTFAVTVTGFVNGETTETAAGYVPPTANSLAIATTGVGKTSITISGGNADNYTFNTDDTATLTINKKALIATATADDKTYDGNTSGSGRISLEGIINGDSIIPLAMFTFANSDADSNKTVNVSITLSGTKVGNYTVNDFITTTANIYKANISGITFEASNATYDGMEKTIEITGTLPSGASVEYTNNKGTNAGTYNATATITGGTNYNGTVLNATLTINKAQLTTTVGDYSKTYGEENPVFEVAVTGFVNGETAATAAGYTAPTASSAATATTGAGTASITISGGSADNYTFDITDTGTLTINKALLTATADNKSKTYGDINPPLTIQYEGFVNSETQAVLSAIPTAVTQVNETTGIGNYDINVSGGSAANYTFTYVNGTMTIQKRALTVKADDKQKTNGESDPALTYMITSGNLVNSDSFIGELARTPGENLTSSAQTYDINRNTLATSENYALTFEKGTLTILPSTNCDLLTVVSLETVGYETESVTVDITSSMFSTWRLYADSACTHEIADKTMQLSVGDNTAYIKVTAQDALTAKTYSLTVHRKSNNADLSGLSTSSGELNPVFSKEQTAYTVILKGEDEAIRIMPIADDETYASISVNGTPVESGLESAQIQMALGANAAVTIEVTAEDGNAKTYTITPYRLSNNNDLSGLAVSQGVLTPSFNKAVTAYTVNVSNDISTINIQPVVDDTGRATVKINGYEISNIKNSLPISLSEGVNEVRVAVTSEDGSEKVYTLTVTRALKQNQKSGNNNLVSLTSNVGILSPLFSKGVTDYSIAVNNSVSVIKLTPVAEDSQNAVIKINGNAVTSGNASEDIALSEGSNTVSVLVTAENGDVKTYTVNITRASAVASTNADLAALSINKGTLSGGFNKNISIYTASVGVNATDITVTAAAEDEKATILINGNKVQSGSGEIVPLKVGANTIKISCIAESGFLKEYSVIVTRYSNRLLKMTLSNGTLSPAFDRNELFYTATVENNVESLTLTTLLERPLSTVTVNGFAVVNNQPSEAILLSEGENEISAVVTAENGEQKTYRMIVYRKAVQTDEEDLIVTLIKRITDSFDDSASNDEVIAAKSNIEEAVKGYNGLSDAKKQTVSGEQKDELFALYERLMQAINYVNKQSAQTYYVEATQGFITNLATKLAADDGETLTIKLNVDKVSAPASAVLQKQVGDTYELTISEIVTRNNDQTVLAKNDNVQPKSNEHIMVKIKVPDSLKGYSGLDIVYIDSLGNATAQNAWIETEGNVTYLVFDAKHFSKYAIVYTKPVSESNQSSSNSSSSKTRVFEEIHEPYIKGYSDNTFRPENNITRAEAAVIISRVSKEYNANQYYANEFPDLEYGSWYLNEVGYGSSSRLITGYEDGTFCPEGQITRAEFAVVMARFLSLEPQETQTSLSDISNHWAKGYITALFVSGLISGYEDGTFRPDAAITRAEAVKIINAAIGRTPDKLKVDSSIENNTALFTDIIQSHWAYCEIMEAALQHKASEFN